MSFDPRCGFFNPTGSKIVKQNITRRLTVTFATLAALLLLSPPPQLSAAPLDTAFTYQGRLNDGVNPANGIYDLQFAIYDAAGGGSVWGVLTNAATPVTNGLFTVTLDFGSAVFDGNARWLEIGVRTNGGGTFATLCPHQPVTPTPYAIYAASATTASSATTATTANAISSTNFTAQLAFAPLNGANLIGILTNNTTGNATTATAAGSATLSTIAQNAIHQFVPSGIPLITMITNFVNTYALASNYLAFDTNFIPILGNIPRVFQASDHSYTNGNGEGVVLIGSGGTAKISITNASYSDPTTNALAKSSGAPKTSFSVFAGGLTTILTNSLGSASGKVMFLPQSTNAASQYQSFPVWQANPTNPAQFYCIFRSGYQDDGTPSSSLLEFCITPGISNWNVSAPWKVVPANVNYDAVDQNFITLPNGIQIITFDPYDVTASPRLTNAMPVMMSVNGGVTWFTNSFISPTNFLYGYGDGGPAQMVILGNRIHNPIYSYSDQSGAVAQYDLYSDNGGTNWTPFLITTNTSNTLLSLA